MLFGSSENEASDAEDGALNSGHTREEIREDVKKREEVLSELDQRIQLSERKARMHFQKALESEGSAKLRHYRKANSYKTYRDGLREVADKVANEQQTLSLMDIQSIKEELNNPDELFDFNIDLAELDVDEVSTAIEQTGIDSKESERVREQLQMSVDAVEAPSPPYSELMEEGEAIEAERIQEEVEDLGEGRDQSGLDDEIRDELEDL